MFIQKCLDFRQIAYTRANIKTLAAPIALAHQCLTDDQRVERGPTRLAIRTIARLGPTIPPFEVAGTVGPQRVEPFARAGLHATFIKGDVLTHEPAEPYDAIVANFFFNMFTPDHARQFLHRFSHVLHPQGRLFISDFKPTGFIATLNYRFALMFFASLGLARWQPMNDCVALLSETGWSVESVRDFGRRYRAITAMPTPP